MARILLAEDDASMLDVLQRALDGDGHSVAAAAGGPEALAFLDESGPFDVLVTDIQMPDVDGLTLATRAVAANPAIKVVLMTAYADGFSIPASVTPRLVATLIKPLALDAVRAAVKSAS